jgi:hypothetical protein
MDEKKTIKKKVYQTPELLEWGTIEELTQGPVGGNADGLTGTEG